MLFIGWVSIWAILVLQAFIKIFMLVKYPLKGRMHNVLVSVSARASTCRTFNASKKKVTTHYVDF